MIKQLPQDLSAYRLLHEGALTFSQISSNGIRVDVNYLNKADKQLSNDINKLKIKMMKDEVYKEWKRWKKDNFKWAAGGQLASVLFDRMGYEYQKDRTKTGKYSFDESVLESLDLPFCKDYLEYRKLEKAQSTYIRNYLGEHVNGYIYPFFNVHLVITYRSSCDSPNFQNIPKRNKYIKNLCRRAFIPRKGNELIETDYGGVEVKVAACYHKDTNMMSYLNDPSKDMHRDMAAECYMISVKDVIQMTKDGSQVRYVAKNRFVFPEFYGSYWGQVGKDLWGAIDELKLEYKGKSLHHHLKRKGINRLGTLKEDEGTSTFLGHIKKVEDRFWGKRFPEYAAWKEKWWRRYLKKGYLKMKTGFVCSGIMARNDAINYPVQGSAFHCTLRSCIRLQQEIKRRRMKTLIVGQIHDAIVSDVPKRERRQYLDLTQEIMIDELQREWKWIIVPMEIESEATETNWSEMEEVK